MNDPVPQHQVGSSINPIYTQRDIKLFALSDTEISEISSVSASVSAYFTLSSFLTALGLSIYTNSVFYDSINAAGKVATNIVAPVLIGTGIVFLILGISGVRRRSKLWNEIRQAPIRSS